MLVSIISAHAPAEVFTVLTCGAVYERDDRRMDLFLKEHKFVEVWNSGELPCIVC